MARSGCSCGVAMSTVDFPSPHVYHIYTQDEVDRALNNDPDCPYYKNRGKFIKFYPGGNKK